MSRKGQPTWVRRQQLRASREHHLGPKCGFLVSPLRGRGRGELYKCMDHAVYKLFVFNYLQFSQKVLDTGRGGGIALMVTQRSRRSNDRWVRAGSPSRGRPGSIATPNASARKAEPLPGIVTTMSRSKVTPVSVHRSHVESGSEPSRGRPRARVPEFDSAQQTGARAGASPEGLVGGRLLELARLALGTSEGLRNWVRHVGSGRHSTVAPQ